MMKTNKPIDWKRNKLVYKANDFIQYGRFDLSTQQQKIMLYIISQIKEDDTEFQQYDFSVTEFCKVCGIDATSGGNYDLLKKQILELTNKSKWVYIDDDTETIVRWIDKPTLHHKSGTITIKLDDDLKPYLLQLKKNYTKYELIYTLHFKSKYTIRLYEYIKSIHYRETESYTQFISIDDLRKRLGAESYAKPSDLIRFAFDKAVKEINEYSDKNVSYTLLRSGRTASAVQITVDSKPTMERMAIREQVLNELGAEQITIWETLAAKAEEMRNE